MSSIRWSDTFLFLYWDIKRYRPEHEKRVDVHIRNFLQELAPSASEDRSPDSWDDKYYDSHEAETATQDVLAILEQMDAAAHRDGPKFNCFNPISLWYQNPFLCEFSNAHMTNPWTVPLPTDMETIVRLVIPNFNGDISKAASVQTLITEYGGLKLHLCFEKDRSGLQPCDVIRLSLNGSELSVINGTAINLLKYCFATVLRWVGRICAEGKPLPGPGISKLRLKRIEEGAFYRLGIEKELWEAVRDYGVQRGRAVQRYNQRRAALLEAAAPTENGTRGRTNALNVWPEYPKKFRPNRLNY
ncbi:hypothetical protein GCG54_00006449 [Colletotrichum gloeosporioides]|uniref:Uncharacterized protein n=1 Tax=Colletotrichum gloeosporioides TaxID=474922 RepID=A0A8H4CR85_COLGL|nr:uncharacterized protein GCG54_00006449 [Colletotrichum gloeosporioides]KAF3808583.1 hypothetical protein GCG54_00006449 [Colletotrichum gloeosporioides]